MNTWESSFSLVGENLGLMSPGSRVQTPQGAPHPIFSVSRQWWSGLTRRA